MKLRCTCGITMAPKLPAGVRPGQKVQVTCKCGQKLRFEAPHTRTTEALKKMLDQATEQMDSQAKMMDDLFGTQSPFGSRYRRPGPNH